MIRFIVSIILFPFKLMLFPFTLIRRDFERTTSDIDKIFDNTKCPKCRSTNVYRIRGHKWHCNNCGRTFKQ